MASLSPEAIASEKSHSDCPLHESPFPPKCFALTTTGRPCRNRASLLTTNLLPRCKMHFNWQKPSGQCEALEECGEPCERICANNEDGNLLCEKHQDYHETRPCYILRLPIELRRMIYEHLFPQEIPAFVDSQEQWNSTMHNSIFKVSRQVSHEAYDVLYEQVLFQVIIDPRGISVCGLGWFCPIIYSNLPAAARPLCKGLPRVLCRIRRFTVCIQEAMDTTFPGPINGFGEGEDDMCLYTIRYNVRLFVDFLRDKDAGCCEPAERQIQICPHVPNYLKRSRFWDPEELRTIIILIIGPLMQLRNTRLHSIGPVEGHEDDSYIELDTHDESYHQFKQLLELSICQTTGEKDTEQTKQRSMDRSIRKLMRLVKTISDYSQGQGPLAIHWEDAVFRGIDGALHYARFLRENEEFELFPVVWESVRRQWAAGHRSLQHCISVISNSIPGYHPMLQSVEWPSNSTTPVPEYVDERHTFADSEVDLLDQLREEFPPFVKEHRNEVEVSQDLEHFFFTYNGQVKFRLKSLELLRFLKDRKFI